MSLLKNISRTLFFPLAVNYLKLHRLILSKSKNNYLIINFHGVSDSGQNAFNNRHMKVADFDKFLKYLKSDFNIVSLSEIFALHENKIVPNRKTIAITFDDGYLNNFEKAWPILKLNNIPATFFLISKGIIDKNYYVWPDIVELAQKFSGEDIILDDHVFMYPGYYCEKYKIGIIDFLRGKGKERLRYISEIADKYPYWKEAVSKYPELIELVRQENLKKYCNESLLELGSHSHTHFNLEYLSDNDCEFELVESAKIIEEVCGKRPVSVAFPDGSYSKDTVKIALKTGYKNLVAVEYLFNENNQADRLLQRFTISNSTTPESNMMRIAQNFDEYGF